MRKLASNYILNHQGELCNKGCILLDNGEVVGYVGLSESVPEEHGVEFYGGMLIPGRVDGKCLSAGCNLIMTLLRQGYFNAKEYRGVTHVSQLDWSAMEVTEHTTLTYIA